MVDLSSRLESGSSRVDGHSFRGQPSCQKQPACGTYTEGHKSGAILEISGRLPWRLRPKGIAANFKTITHITSLPVNPHVSLSAHSEFASPLTRLHRAYPGSLSGILGSPLPAFNKYTFPCSEKLIFDVASQLWKYQGKYDRTLTPNTAMLELSAQYAQVRGPDFINLMGSCRVTRLLTGPMGRQDMVSNRKLTGVCGWWCVVIFADLLYSTYSNPVFFCF